MFTILGPFLDRSGIPRYIFKKQLESEFGVQVKQITPEEITAVSPSEDEIRFVQQGFLKQVEAYYVRNGV